MQSFPTSRVKRTAGLAGLVALLLLLGGARVQADGEGRSQNPIKATLDRTLTPEQLCTVRFLRHLGWRFHLDSTVRCVTARGGWPCRRSSIEAARAAGDLRVLLPTPFGPGDARAFAQLAPSIVDSLPSRGAFQHKLAAASLRATARLDKLNKSERVVFPELFGIVHSPIFVMKLPEPEWERKERLFVPSQSVRHAFEAIYARGAVVDCYVGQCLAVLGAQYELHGPVGFDEAFKPAEIGFGRSDDHLGTPLGKVKDPRNTYRWRALMIEEKCWRRDPFLTLAPHGPLAFVGLSGCVNNCNPQEFTNDNFVIVSISEKALEAIARGRGRTYFNKELKRVWKAAKEDPKSVDDLLAAPVFSEVKIYVQPYGIVPLSRIVKKWLPRTGSALTLRLYVNGQEDLYYQRYREGFERRCKERLKREREAAAAR